MFYLPFSFFGSQCHTLTLPFAPYSTEMCLSMECLLLAETCHSAFAREQGPTPNLRLFAPWNENFPNSTLYPSPTAMIKLANFWYEFIDFFNLKTQHEPLPYTLLLTLKRELLILLEKQLHKHMNISTHASIYSAYNGNNQVDNTLIIISRPFTDFSPTCTPLGDSWLKLREQFDAKEAPTQSWSLQTYLEKHQDKYKAFQQKMNTSNSSNEI